MSRRNCGFGLCSLVGATAVGTMVGLLVGVMFAPKSGGELRGELVTSGRDLVNKVKTKRDDFLEGINDKVEEVEDFVD